MGLDQHAGREAQQQGGGVAEDAHDVRSALDLLAQPLQRVGAPRLASVCLGEVGEGGDLLRGVVHHRFCRWQLGPQPERDGSRPGPGPAERWAGRRWSGSQRRPFGLALGDPGEDASHEGAPVRSALSQRPPGLVLARHAGGQHLASFTIFLRARARARDRVWQDSGAGRQ